MWFKHRIVLSWFKWLKDIISITKRMTFRDINIWLHSLRINDPQRASDNTAIVCFVHASFKTYPSNFIEFDGHDTSCQNNGQNILLHNEQALQGTCRLVNTFFIHNSPIYMTERIQEYLRWTIFLIFGLTHIIHIIYLSSSDVAWKDTSPLNFSMR